MIASIRQRIVSSMDERGTTLVREIVAGIALFLSLSYIFIVNPTILAEAKIPAGAAFFATVVTSAAFTIWMGVYAKLPFAVAPGLESSSFFVFVVVASLGFSWQQALGLVFWSGILCVLLTWIPIRPKIIDAIPEGLRAAITASVGIFVLVIGLVVTDVLIYDQGMLAGVGELANPKLALLLLGLFISAALAWKPLRFPAGMLVAIIICSIVARPLGVAVDTPAAEPEEFIQAVGRLDLLIIFKDPRAWTALLIFFMIDFYGSIGKFIGLTRGTNLADIPEIKDPKAALYIDSWGTVGGSIMGTSTIITFVESSIAIKQGGRTGIVAVVAGILMLLSLLFAPLVQLVPVAAVGGVLVFVGILLQPTSELIDAAYGTKDPEGRLDYYDLTIIVIMGAIAFFTFSLDKSMLFGFVAYSVKQAAFNKGRVNLYLLGSTIALGLALGFQYIWI